MWKNLEVDVTELESAHQHLSVSHTHTHSSPTFGQVVSCDGAETRVLSSFFCPRKPL